VEENTGVPGPLVLQISQVLRVVLFVQILS